MRRMAALIPSMRSGANIGARYDTSLEAADLIKAGIPFNSISHFQKASGFNLERIKAAIRMSEGSFARRKQSGRLSRDESERFLRLGRIFELATSLFEGDPAGARQWLETPIPSLGNRRPLDLLQTEPGAREVENLICRIEHGVVS